MPPSKVSVLGVLLLYSSHDLMILGWGECLKVVFETRTELPLEVLNLCDGTQEN